MYVYLAWIIDGLRTGSVNLQVTLSCISVCTRGGSRHEINKLGGEERRYRHQTCEYKR